MFRSESTCRAHDSPAERVGDGRLRKHGLEHDEHWWCSCVRTPAVSRCIVRQPSMWPGPAWVGPTWTPKAGRCTCGRRTRTSKSTCTGACATAWPPLEASARPTAGSGVKSSLLGTTKRADGSEQVTYNGHPLYTFQGDTASGQTNGQRSNGFGALWLVLSPTGTQIASSASSGGSSPSTGY